MRLRILFQLGGLLLGVASLHATPLTDCGQSLVAGDYELTADLVCPHHAVTLTGGAHLDLQGHQIVCNQFEPGPCVVLDGWGNSLKQGTIDGGTTDALDLRGTGGHTVANVTIALIDTALIVVSPGNLLSSVRLTSTTSPALVLEGAGNWLVANMALCPFSVFGCVQVRGSANALLWTSVVVQEGFLDQVAAIEVLGNANWLYGTRAINLDGIGVRVAGTGNTLQDTTAMGSTLDVQDMHADCDDNRWIATFARTADPACIALPTIPTVVQR